jgi:hypothetical protein
LHLINIYTLIIVNFVSMPGSQIMFAASIYDLISGIDGVKVKEK